MKSEFSKLLRQEKLKSDFPLQIFPLIHFISGIFGVFGSAAGYSLSPEGNWPPFLTELPFVKPYVL